MKNIFNNKKVYSRQFKSECINYIGKTLSLNEKTIDFLNKIKENIKERDERFKVQNQNIE